MQETDTDDEKKDFRFSNSNTENLGVVEYIM